MSMTVEADPALTRAMLLRESTNTAHSRLDQRIMAGDPFADRERYGRFLQMQYLFHLQIDALYDFPSMLHWLPDLGERRRRGLIAQDLQDLGIAVPDDSAALRFASREPVDVATALGWLYVAEGSNLGAAFLLKEAAKLGLGETFGARHLAAHPQGRGLHWRMFTTALNSVQLTKEEEERAILGASEAFAHVRALVEQYFPISSSEANPPGSADPAQEVALQ